MVRIEFTFTDKRAREIEYFLRAKFALKAPAYYTLNNLCKIAVLEAVADQAKLECDEAIEKMNNEAANVS